VTHEQRAHHAPPEHSNVPEHVVAMEAFAAAHYREPIRVSDIAAAVGLHPAYASILYSRTRGTTLIRHLTQLRISYARQRLSRPDAPAVVRVAFESGFCSLSSFYEAFPQADQPDADAGRERTDGCSRDGDHFAEPCIRASRAKERRSRDCPRAVDRRSAAQQHRRATCAG
jgi:AraC-like DNA-binding protein